MKHLLLTLFTLLALSVQASPVTDMLERIDKGASKKFKFELLKNDGKEFFELDQQGQKVVIRGHNCRTATRSKEGEARNEDVAAL